LTPSALPDKTRTIFAPRKRNQHVQGAPSGNERNEHRKERRVATDVAARVVSLALKVMLGNADVQRKKNEAFAGHADPKVFGGEGCW